MDFELFAFSTAIGKKIEQATSELNALEDWALNLEIADDINSSDSGPKDAAKAIKKRLASKDERILLLTLTVLETCVMNCGQRFAVAIANREFMDKLAAVAEQRNACGERARGLLATWVAGFRAQADYMKPLYDTYARLRAESGLDFPAVDASRTTPIDLPPKTRNHGDHIPFNQIPPEPVVQLQPREYAVTGAPVDVTSDDIARLRNNLLVVMNNVIVMQEMMDETRAGAPPSDLLRAVAMTTREMHVRVMTLITQVDHPELMGELLNANEALVACLGTFDTRFAASKQRSASAAERPSAVSFDDGQDVPLLDLQDEATPRSPSPLDNISLDRGIRVASPTLPRSPPTTASVTSQTDLTSHMATLAVSSQEENTLSPEGLDEDDFDAFLNQATFTVAPESRSSSQGQPPAQPPTQPSRDSLI